MRIINNAGEWVDFCKRRYPGSPFKPDKFPPAYPCEADTEEVDGGIGGDYVAFQVRYATGLPHAPHTPWETIFYA